MDGLERLQRAESEPASSLSLHRGPSSWQAVRMNAKSTIAGTVDLVLGSSPAARKKKKPRTNKPSRTASVTLGPIIGKVTDATARVLLEVDKDAFVTAMLDPEPDVVEDDGPQDRPNRSLPSLKSWAFMRPGGSLSKFAARKQAHDTATAAEEAEDQQIRHHHQRIEVERELKAGRPGVFVFVNLRPNTRYRLRFRGCDSALVGGFKTLVSACPSELSIGVISCNNVHVTQNAIPTHSDLWAHLAKTIQARKLDYLVHLGDQIYADVDPKYPEWGGQHSNRYRAARLLLQGEPATQWTSFEEEICEIYRGAYRETWQHPATARCLANCPNLMILDDHEVRDNWGDLPQDWDPKNLDFFIARCAWRVYLEYQRQLHEDVDFSQVVNIRKEHHLHVLGGVAFIFLDIRGSRTFHRVENDDTPYLGTQQWKDITRWLSSGGGLDKVQALLLCSPAPLVFLEPLITNVAAKNVSRLEDFKGHWSARLHFKEQIRMIDLLAEWKAGKDGREVLVLGGDVHCGGFSDVMKNGKVVFKQLTCSAIANSPLPKSAYYAMRLAGFGGSLRPGYGFKHYTWTRSRNYGLVRIRIIQERTEMTAQLVKGKFMRGIRYSVKVTNVDPDKRRRRWLFCYALKKKKRQRTLNSLVVSK